VAVARLGPLARYLVEFSVEFVII